MKILVVGSSGMIGSTVLRVLSENNDSDVFGSIRDENCKRFFSESIAARLVAGVDVEQTDHLVKLLDQIRPDVVVNCAGLTKHKPEADDPLVSIPINTLMPHRLAGLCKLVGARLIHVSTDCVFSGAKGRYVEDDFADARDVYGKSKALGELHYPHTVTLRTSTIGHELQSQYGLLDWFLAQEGRCKGYSRAIFSGLPTVVFAQIIRDFVIPNLALSGLYHIAAKPINKLDLLGLIADVYAKQIDIIPDDKLILDRSLDAQRFQLATGYIAPEWPELINTMHAYK
ncbi:dTDP-4-dehydrorhamnose reductase family protein [Gallionella capsiferriformans]|uniref:dTDP-4-dehydrorhamnose reductase n=1 Tax=Gallionella capsiferriformans (strain ES-2) TaxID=395494 RepID=D9SE04_GALCS|nr:SDR family oxidoreductase [Gallionella capsiferriformans]ADL56826.1 dTDP-4-dehydrorhamnose reductase [Gallionella capsiferriformans ES-2]